MTNSTKNTAPKWTVGMAAGVAIGMGLGVTLHDLLLGIALSLCFGVALAYTLPAKDTQDQK